LYEHIQLKPCSSLEYKDSPLSTNLGLAHAAKVVHKSSCIGTCIGSNAWKKALRKKACPLLVAFIQLKPSGSIYYQCSSVYSAEALQAQDITSMSTESRE